jgi:hypothetical protein
VESDRNADDSGAQDKNISLQSLLLGAILKPGKPFGFISLHPFANCVRADPGRLREVRERLSASHQIDDPLSTAWGQTGILVHVHPVLLPGG